MDLDAISSTNKVARNLWIGSLSSLNSGNERGVSHILAVCKTEPVQWKGVSYMQVAISDSLHSDIYSHFDHCIEFIQKGRDTGGVLVVCQKGISRSATVIIAYLMWRYDLSLLLAYQTLWKRRHFVRPNNGFLEQLALFDRRLAAEKTSFPPYCPKPPPEIAPRKGALPGRGSYRIPAAAEIIHDPDSENEESDTDEEFPVQDAEVITLLISRSNSPPLVD